MSKGIRRYSAGEVAGCPDDYDDGDWVDYDDHIKAVAEAVARGRRQAIELIRDENLTLHGWHRNGDTATIDEVIPEEWVNTGEYPND